METDDTEVIPVLDISTRPVIPDPYEEDAIADDSVYDVPGVSEGLCITCELTEGATRGGNTLTVDSLGYTCDKKAFGEKKSQCINGKCNWRFTVRSKALTCPATVTQYGSVKVKVTARVKTMARDKDNVIKSAITLVDRPMTQIEEESLLVSIQTT